MYKMLTVDHSKCTGCRLCEIVCSAKKNGSVNPSRARLAVIKWEQACVDMPMICQQCESAPCMMVCPVKALSCGCRRLQGGRHPGPLQDAFIPLHTGDVEGNETVSQTRDQPSDENDFQHDECAIRCW